ncbi:hypothetical protein [Micromonospora sp. IBHARD004]|uniref:hypothetical protein n=1 Tax=Micromonospora sp. IBHARD004 TaxID=3457764 RepID=UPI00405992B3
MLLVPVVSVAPNAYGTITQDPSFQTGSRAVWQTLAIVAIVWSVVDERVTMSFGPAFLYVVISRAMGDLVALDSWSMWHWTLVDMGVAVRRARI